MISLGLLPYFVHSHRISNLKRSLLSSGHVSSAFKLRHAKNASGVIQWLSKQADHQGVQRAFCISSLTALFHRQGTLSLEVPWLAHIHPVDEGQKVNQSGSLHPSHGHPLMLSLNHPQKTDLTWMGRTLAVHKHTRH